MEEENSSTSSSWFGSIGSPEAMDSIRQRAGRMNNSLWRAGADGHQPPVGEYPTLGESFADMSIYTDNNIYDSHHSFNGIRCQPMFHSAALREHSMARSSVAKDAARAFSSYPAPNHISSSIFGNRSDQGNSWRIWNQGPSSTARPWGQCSCLPCSDFVALATNPKTSRKLQTSIKTMNRSLINHLFWEFLNKIEMMMNHPSANFVSQSLIEIFTADQIDKILCKLCSNGYLHRLCLNNHGRRALQKLLERITEPQQIDLLMESLKPSVLQLVNNEEGRDLILFCLMKFSDEGNKLILEEVAQNCDDIGASKKGYYVLTRIINHFAYHFTINRVVLKNHGLAMLEMAQNAATLAFNQFGNYPVQSLLELRIPCFTEIILDQLKGQFHSLSTDKYGSNVVEKCLKTVPRIEQLEQIISELLYTSDASSLFLNEYGNYVMQTALKVSLEQMSPIHRDLLDSLRKNQLMLQGANFSKQLLKWLR